MLTTTATGAAELLHTSQPAISRAASASISRKTATSGRLALPGKLADCSSSNRDESELFPGPAMLILWLTKNSEGMKIIGAEVTSAVD